jgi:multiple sugar transport system substrate-binding protein
MLNMRGRVRIAAALVAVTALAACGGGDEGGEGGGDASSITVWTGDTLPDRLAATEAIIERFTEQTGVQVELVSVDEDQFNQLLTSGAAAGELPDVVGSYALVSMRTLQAAELLNTDVAAAVIESLGEDTFSQTGLELTRDGDTQLSVPSEAWSQLLIYRKDLFDAAGLPAPTTYEDITSAAAALNQPGNIVGFVGATAPGDAFTQQTFEHIALANNCQLVDDAGEITINSSECVDSFAFYGDLIRNYSVPGAQDVDTVRAAYFAGQAAMFIWSTFILDEMAGLRNDALPSCPQCQADPAFLAKNSGIVTAMQGPDGQEPAQFGEVVGWAATADAAAEPSQQFIEFMMSDGYIDWIAIAPEGKFPIRRGTQENPTEYVDTWKTLPVGVDTKAPLDQFYPPDVLATIAEAPDPFVRWGITQGQGRLIGASLGELPVPAAVAAVTNGGVDPQTAADEAASTLQSIQDSLQ